MEIRKVYLDMDGVLADFDRGVEEMCHLPASSQNGTRDEARDERMWEAIRGISHFYAKLQLMAGAKEMFDRIYAQFGDRTEILTGIPKPQRGIVTAGEDKTEWMKRNLSDRVRMNIVLRREKKNYCTGPESVLIDDREETILEWRELGGTGILHVNPEETLRILRELAYKPEERTLGELLSEPSIARIAPEAIRARELDREEAWGKTIRQIREEHFFAGQVGAGISRLMEAAATGEWYYPLYSEAECAADGRRKGLNLLWLPSTDPAADEKPFLFLVPGGGFENVWNLTEGWPIGDAFNRLGYHAFVLTYHVGENERLLEKNMEDFARALQMIRKNAGKFHVSADRYITCGFSAGGYLICLWNTALGYPKHGLPKPEACIPVYPFVSPKLVYEKWGDPEPADSTCLYGCPLSEAIRKEYEIAEHAEGFPPTAIFLAGDDGMVEPENSEMLAAALEKNGIPCRLETGESGGHGFGDGTGMCMEGWPERGLRWAESQRQKY